MVWFSSQPCAVQYFYNTQGNCFIFTSFEFKNIRIFAISVKLLLLCLNVLLLVGYIFVNNQNKVSMKFKYLYLYVYLLESGHCYDLSLLKWQLTAVTIECLGKFSAYCIGSTFKRYMYLKGWAEYYFSESCNRKVVEEKLHLIGKTSVTFEKLLYRNFSFKDWYLIRVYLKIWSVKLQPFSSSSDPEHFTDSNVA